MNPTKIQLSEDELAFVQNAQLLLTKNAIINKAVEAMGEMHVLIQRLMKELGPPLPAEVLASSAKISKGEKYEGLPWVMLDYPRYFGKDAVFAVRTMFWWGNFFSITLHLSGVYKQQFREVLLRNRMLLQECNFYLCVGEDEWRHDFSPTNYVSLDRLSEQAVEDILSVTDFCKLSVRIPLQMWNLSVNTADTLYRAIFNALMA
ncbi:hypothetical protein [Pseudoflavitalea rhizosphaerae]|uniref:hypothetical protein n=1 Tax=Pseudoflavitalea rhizosphaerae TaxID=1884793 RepID=UPI000F8F589B|nr:hypothetical protein [Pseudoflavitalea rhizosphaerae]